jgi:hypothetical protein
MNIPWYAILDIGGIAQLGERVLCKHEVVGSIPSASTKIYLNLHETFNSKGGAKPPADL